MLPGIAKATEYVKKNNPSDYGNMDYLSCWNTSLVVAEILRNAVKNVGYDVLAKGDANAWKAVEQSGIQKLNGYDVEGLQGPVSYTPGAISWVNRLRYIPSRAARLLPSVIGSKPNKGIEDISLVGY